LTNVKFLQVDQDFILKDLLKPFSIFFIKKTIVSKSVYNAGKCLLIFDVIGKPEGLKF